MRLGWLCLILLAGCGAPSEPPNVTPQPLEATEEGKEAVAFADRSFKAISADWNAKELLALASERYKKEATPKQVEDFLRQMKEKLGKVESAGPWKLSEDKGLWAKAAVQFEAGSGQARIRLVWQEPQWYVDEFAIFSPHLLPK
jgi:hypothetical protein